jgi:hypothetical protein
MTKVTVKLEVAIEQLNTLAEYYRLRDEHHKMQFVQVALQKLEVLKHLEEITK